MATTKVLLLEDVGARGRKGDIVDVKSGFARNFLVPQGRAMRATKQAQRMQEALQEERKKQAALDKASAEKQAAYLSGKVLETSVKVDKGGHMYGSVSAVDVQRLLKEQNGVDFNRRNIVLPHPIKKIGVTEVTLRLKEDVTCQIKVKITAEGVVATEEEAPSEEEASTEEASAEETQE